MVGCGWIGALGENGAFARADADHRAMRSAGEQPLPAVRSRDITIAVPDFAAIRENDRLEVFNDLVKKMSVAREAPPKPAQVK